MTWEPGDGLGIGNNSACPAGSGMDPVLSRQIEKADRFGSTPLSLVQLGSAL